MIVNAIAYRSKISSDDPDLSEMLEGSNYVVLQCFDKSGFRPVSKAFLPNECHLLYVLAKHTVAFCLIDLHDLEDPIYVDKVYLQGYTDLVTQEGNFITTTDVHQLEFDGDVSYMCPLIDTVFKQKGISAEEITPKVFSRLNNDLFNPVKPFHMTCTLPIVENA